MSKRIIDLTTHALDRSLPDPQNVTDTHVCCAACYIAPRYSIAKAKINPIPMPKIMSTMPCPVTVKIFLSIAQSSKISPGDVVVSCCISGG